MGPTHASWFNRETGNRPPTDSTTRTPATIAQGTSTYGEKIQPVNVAATGSDAPFPEGAPKNRDAESASTDPSLVIYQAEKAIRDRP